MVKLITMNNATKTYPAAPALALLGGANYGGSCHRLCAGYVFWPSHPYESRRL